jgi:pseudouridylate synthase
MHPFLQFSDDVANAIAQKKPVVALESTIISHGMPYPQNLKCAQEVEDIFRKKGVTPATIALYEGKIHIGIDATIMEHLANNTEVQKASKRDIAYILTTKRSASTTVAATMQCAYMANIQVFVTGGIGGVHPDVSQYFDISADLLELAQTPVTVVCSGAKSILDLPKTLEMLETHGVPVIGYKTSDFPAFYSHSSGLPLVHRMDEADTIAQLIQNHRSLNINTGMVIANPIPHEAEIPVDEITPIIAQAQKEAKNINGKAITPFLLGRIAELTEGQSLKANMALIKNNAQLGADIALALHQ